VAKTTISPDLNALHQSEGLDAVRGRIDSAEPWTPPPRANGGMGWGAQGLRQIPEQNTARFKLTPFDALKHGTEPEYLIRGLLPRGGLIVAWGPPKCGKSFWIMDAMLHVALGWEYRGRRVHQGAVVYCAFEGQSGYGKRAEAFRLRKLTEHRNPVPFYLVASPMNFVADHHNLIAAIRAQLGDAAKPAAVVLDTLNRSLVGSESDDKDMGAYMKAAGVFAGAFWAVVAMGVAFEAGKLSAVAWLGQHRGGRIGAALVVLVAVLMAFNAVGTYGFLAKAHIAHVVAGEVQTLASTADVEARLSVQAGVVADLDRQIAQIDTAIEKTTERGRGTSAMKLADGQRRNRAELTAERIREGKALASLQVEKATVDGERLKVEADLGPVRYLAILLGADNESVLRYFILAVALWLDPAAVLLVLAASARR